MFALDKKGAFMDHLNEIILVIFVAILLLGIFVGIKNLVEDEGSLESCRVP